MSQSFSITLCISTPPPCSLPCLLPYFSLSLLSSLFITSPSDPNSLFFSFFTRVLWCQEGIVYTKYGLVICYHMIIILKLGVYNFYLVILGRGLKSVICGKPFFFWFGGVLGSASRAKFPVSPSNHFGFTPRLLYNSTHHYSECFIDLKTG